MMCVEEDGEDEGRTPEAANKNKSPQLITPLDLEPNNDQPILSTLKIDNETFDLGKF
jgi:hypothetical protein